MCLQPWSQGLEKSFYTYFAPPHPCAMLTKHFDLTQVCILLFSDIEKGSGGAATYSVGITVVSLCFSVPFYNLFMVVASLAGVAVGRVIGSPI